MTTATTVGSQRNWVVLINFSIARQKEKFNTVSLLEWQPLHYRYTRELLIKYNQEEEVQFLVRYGRQKQKAVSKTLFLSSLAVN